jgi:hypothetical protein
LAFGVCARPCFRTTMQGRRFKQSTVFLDTSNEIVHKN